MDSDNESIRNEGSDEMSFLSTLHEPLKRINLPMIPHIAACLCPDDGNVKTMDARSKCFTLKPYPTTSTAIKNTDGCTLAFVAPCHVELPDHAQKVCCYFSHLNDLTDFAQYVIPTDIISLVKSRTNQKVVTGLVARAVIAARDNSVDATSDAIVSTSNIIRGRYMSSGDSNSIPVPFLKIRVGFTGATFDVDGTERRMNFACVFITPASNFAMWECLHEKLVSQPKQNCPNYDKLYEEWKHYDSMINEIMRTEICDNLKLSESEFGMPETFRVDPAGYLGYLTLLNQCQLPFKILNLIRTKYANASDIRIMGMPRAMTFRRNDDPTREFIRYLHLSINCAHRNWTQLMECLDKYNTAKGKATEEYVIQCVGGWPVKNSEEGVVELFGLPPLPLMHDLDVTGIRGFFKVWLSNIGGPDGLPDLTRAHLRAFLVRSTDINSVPNIQHFMMDRRIANLKLIFQKYFSSDSNVLDGLVISGKLRAWWTALRSDIRIRRDASEPILEVHGSITNYILSAVQNMHSMIQCGVFRSMCITQAKDICDKINYEEACLTGECSIRETIVRYSDHNLSSLRKFDPFARVCHTYWKIWEHINDSAKMNSGNLAFAVETFTSQLMFRFGDTNASWTHFFITILVMSGYGHFIITDKNGSRRDPRKPNTTGFNFVLKRITDVVDLIYDRAGVKESERLQSIMDVLRWTPVSWEVATMATVVQGQVQSMPDERIAECFLIASELRGADQLKPLIHHVVKRGEEAATTMAINTADTNKTNVRSLQWKARVAQACLVAITGNKGDQDHEGAEERKTLSVVMPVMCPGAGPFVKKRKIDDSYTYFDTDRFTSQQMPIKDKDMVANFIPFSNIFAQVNALSNRLGLIPVEINEVVLGLLDWGNLYIKQMASGMMDSIALESISRMQQGYKSRAVVWSCWMQNLMYMASAPDKDEAVVRILQSTFCHALPVAAVPVVLHNLLARCVNMQCLLMASIAAQHIELPVIQWKFFKRFCIEPDPPGTVSEDYEDFKRLRTFIKNCLDNNMFCPEDPGEFSPESNFSFYVTSPGTPDMTVLNPKTSMFRVPPRNKSNYSDTSEIYNEVAKRIADLIGTELASTCHMGPEVSIYQNAIMTTCCNFVSDLRSLIGPTLFYGKRHLTKLGLIHHMTGAQDYDAIETPSFAKPIVFSRHTEVKSAGVAFNLWSLIGLVSLMQGPMLHPHVSDIFAKNFVKEIMSNTPVSCLPGGAVYIRSFTVDTATTECIVVGSENRPRHLIRPSDTSFVVTGRLMVAKQIGRFLPEDMMHCSFLQHLAEFYRSDILHLPAEVIFAKYELCANTMYTFHSPGKTNGRYGFFIVIPQTETVEFRITSDSITWETRSEGYYTWDQYIQDQSFVLTPLITRPGACVTMNLPDKNVVACIMATDLSSGSCFSPESCGYKVSYAPDQEFADIFFLDVLFALIPVGETLFLDMSVIPDERFRKDGKFLVTRLNVPNVKFPEDGKVFVSAKNSSHYDHSVYHTWAVNPWDLRLESEYESIASLVIESLT